MKSNLQVELTRYRVKDGMSREVDAWMAFLKDHLEDTLLTLEAEQMYVESIFREILDGHEYLYWYSIQGKDGQAVEESESYIDKEHLRYWRLCIDLDYAPVDLTMQLTMIPSVLESRMD